MTGVAARLEPAALAAIVEPFVRTADTKRWDRFGFDWDAIDPERLTEGHRSAVEFITFIEDHLPGYLAEYAQMFPVDDSVDLDTFAHNREMYRFSVVWGQEEDAHAHVLFTYQVRSGMAEPDALRRRLAAEGIKKFVMPYEHPVQMAAYTLIQEKATQLFYQQFAHSTGEPILQDILRALARDEARHFSFFADLMQAYVARLGERVLPEVKDVLQTFRMPLADTLKRYWRWAIEVADSVGGYDHTEAYEALEKTVQKAADSSLHSKTTSLDGFVRGVRAL